MHKSLADLQAVYLSKTHRLGVMIGDESAEITLHPDEMRAFACQLWLAAEAIENAAGVTVDAMLARASGRPN